MRVQKTGAANLERNATTLSGVDDKKSIAESHLKGNTLRTYIYVVTHKKSGVREIQRELHFSSSSLAQYHLGKLVDLGLLNEREESIFLLIR